MKLSKESVKSKCKFVVGTCLREKFSIKLCLTVFQDWKQKKNNWDQFSKSNWRKEVLETFFFILSKLIWKEKLFLIITSGWVELRRSIQSMIEKTIQVFSFQFFPKTKFWFWHNCCNLTQLHNFEERKKFQYSFFFHSILLNRSFQRTKETISNYFYQICFDPACRVSKN